MLKTRWSDKVDTLNPLPEYPRPQLVRDTWISLNGKWNYAVNKSEREYPADFSGEIIVPFAIESQLSGVCRKLMPDERLWYKREFSLNEDFIGKRCLLHFGAVDWKCAVYVNRKLVIRHVGGYCPFTADITDYIKDGINSLVVCVFDPTDAGWQQRGKQSLKSHSFWYTGTSGIWQTVWLEAVCEKHIKKLRITPDFDNSSVNVRTFTSCDDVTLRLTVHDGDEKVFSSEISSVADIPLPSFKAWSPENPHLYDLTVELYSDGILCDTVKSYFGMRKFSTGTVDGITRLFLNNEPYFQRGLLDQGYYPDGGLTPPTDEAMIYDIRKMKELGFNMLRKHIKVDLARWYYHCDRLGMIVWQDMVSGGRYIGDFYAGVVSNIAGFCPALYTLKVSDNKNYSRFSRDKKEWRDDFERELFEVLDTLYNTVSIYCWVPFNEAWGQFDARRISESVKAYDSTRVVDHASGWYDQGAGDIQSMHKYILPIPPVKTDDRAFVISEFGGYSRVINGHVWNKSKSFGYIMYKNEEKLTKAYKKLMEKQILPLIPKYLSAFIYTQVSDVEFEVNGILSYDREIVKLDEDTVKSLNEKMTY